MIQRRLNRRRAHAVDDSRHELGRDIAVRLLEMRHHCGQDRLAAGLPGALLVEVVQDAQAAERRFSRHARPYRKLGHAERIAGRDVSPELAELVTAFNAMLGRLDEDPPTESELEAMFWRLLERLQLELPERQASFDWLGHGRGRVDFWYEAARLVVEFDFQETGVPRVFQPRPAAGPAPCTR